MSVPLHVKSEWSFGSGTAPVRRLARRGRELGHAALALTDVEGLHGQIAFHHACRSAGLRPITGVELREGFGPAAPGLRGGRVVLLAPDREGYRSLCRIVTARRAGARGTPTPDPLDSVARFPEGLVALTDDPAALARLAAVGGLAADRIGALVVRPGRPRAEEADLATTARRLGASLVADLDVVLPSSADHELHELLVAIRARRTVAAVRRAGLAESPERILRSRAELQRLFHDLPEALGNAERLRRECRLDLRHADPALPQPQEHDGAGARLARACRERLERGRVAGRWRDAAYDRRLAVELSTIGRLGFSAYFLAVAEIVDGAAVLGIPIAGRGSAAGSLVVHLLGATEPDPVAGGLLFERFLSERRRDLPDVDLDVASHRRDELLEWVARRFGRERVAMVSAHGTFRRRSAYREGLKALGIPRSEVERLCRRIPEDGEPPLPPSSLEPAASGAEPAPPLPASLRGARALLERLIGRPQYVAAHPGGVAIADGPIGERIPLERTAKGAPTSQYDLRSLEHTGLLKIDLLGNHCLSELAETLARLRETRGAAGPVSHRDLPPDDAATLATLDRADTIGCFQFESPAVRSVLAQLPIRSFEDAVAALALVRPGAASGKAKRAFVRRAHGEEPEEVLLPALQRRLRPTHGLLLYEEDVICLVAALTGSSLAEADELRAAVVSAGDDPAATAAIERRVLERAAAHGIAPTVARDAWTRIRSFAAYAFSKAHAASYALLGCRAVHLRTHAPVPFGCAVLNHHGGLYPLRTLASAVERWGVALVPPSVLLSHGPCTVEPVAGGCGQGVRVGLGKVKGLSTRTLARLLRSRDAEGPYRDLGDLLARAAPSARELEALVLCGACDGLEPLAAASYPFAHEAVLESIRRHGRAELPGGWRLPLAGDREEAARLEVYRSLVRIRNELRHLEMHVSAHPLRVLRAEAERQGCLTTQEARERPGERVSVAAVLAASRRVATREGAPMQFVTLEDETGTLEAMAPPGAYAALGRVLTQPGPFLLNGAVRDDHGDRHLVLAQAQPFHRRERPYAGLGSTSRRGAG